MSTNLILFATLILLIGVILGLSGSLSIGILAALLSLPFFLTGFIVKAIEKNGFKK